MLTDWSMPVMDGLDLGQDGAVVRVDVSSGHVPAKPTNNIPFRGAGRRAQWEDTSQKLNSAAQKLTDD